MKQQSKNRTWIRILSLAVALIFAAGFLSGEAHAADESRSFRFELSVDGQTTKEVKTGDIITVMLTLVRTDSDEPYPMYAMQDEIRYDSAFFELVPGSAMLADGVQSVDVELRDSYREFYMNFLSFGGGEQWSSKTVVGSFQLKVIGTSGVTKITNEDYLVPLSDGSDRYKSEANELTIVLSTYCTVRFETNGGTQIDDVSAIYGESIAEPETPEREGKYFCGWYKDLDLTDEWDFETDKVYGNMTLYAKWSDIPAGEDPEPSESQPTEDPKPSEEPPTEEPKPSDEPPAEDPPAGENDGNLLPVVIAVGGGIILLLLILLLLEKKKSAKKESDE